MRSDLLGDVGAGPAELRAETLLRGRPDHVAVLVHQAHGGDRFVAPLGGVLGLVLAGAEAAIRAAAVLDVRPASRIRVRIQAVRGVVRLGEDQVLGRAAQDRVGALLILGHDEQLRALQCC